MSIYRQHVTFVGTRYIKWKGYCMYLHQQKHFYGVSLISLSGPTTIVHNSSQYLALMQLILKNNLAQTRSFEFSDSTEIGGILTPFSPTKSLLWRMFLFSPSGPATTIYNSSQYLVLMQLISHKPGHLSFPILLK